MKNRSYFTEEGYTLSETLIVLMVFMMITTLIMFSFDSTLQQLREKLFLHQLQTDMYVAQSYALNHQQSVHVIFSPLQYRYLITDSKGNSLVERNYAKNILVYKGSLPLDFKFKSNGNINQFGSFYIKIANQQYRMTFLIGRGRFYVLKQ